MIVIKEFNTIFLKVDNNDCNFDDCLKLVFKDDVYVSAKDFFSIKYGIEIATADIIVNDITHLVLQFDDSIAVDDLYAINSTGTISVCPKIGNDDYVEALTFKFAI